MARCECEPCDHFFTINDNQHAEVACARQLYNAEGVAGFTRGYSAVLMRAGPVNAVLFPAVDVLKPLIEEKLPEG